MRRRRLAAGFQEIEGADDVRVDEGARRLKPGADAGLGGEVDDDVGLGVLDEAHHPVGVLQHEVVEGEAGAAEETRQAVALQADMVVRRHAVEADAGGPEVEQPLGDVVADEAGRPCHQHLAAGKPSRRRRFARVRHLLTRRSTFPRGPQPQPFAAIRPRRSPP